MLIIEEWKDIEGFDGRYKISNHGRVMICERQVAVGRSGVRLITAGIMAQHEWFEYKVVWLRHPNGPRKKYRVHRIVAFHFIPNPDNKPLVNHIDRDRRNNHISNLEWVTDSENTRHWMAHDKMTEEQRKLAEMPF